MKKILLGTVGFAVVSMAAPASAADLAARPYTKAPPPMIAADLRLERLLHRPQRRLAARAHKCWTNTGTLAAP